jgi:hypothetical protein
LLTKSYSTLKIETECYISAEAPDNQSHPRISWSRGLKARLAVESEELRVEAANISGGSRTYSRALFSYREDRYPVQDTHERGSK